MLLILTCQSNGWTQEWKDKSKPWVRILKITDLPQRKKRIDFGINHMHPPDRRGGIIILEISDDDEKSWKPLTGIHHMRNFRNMITGKRNRYSTVWKTYLDYHKNCKDLKLRIRAYRKKEDIPNTPFQKDRYNIAVTSVHNGINGNIIFTKDNNIYTKDLQTETTEKITSGTDVSVFEENIIYVKDKNVYIRDLQTDSTQQITESKSCYNPKLRIIDGKKSIFYWRLIKNENIDELINHETGKIIYSVKRNHSESTSYIKHFRKFDISYDARELILNSMKEGRNSGNRLIINSETGAIKEKSNEFYGDIQFLDSQNNKNDSLLIVHDGNVYISDRKTGISKLLTKNFRPFSYQLYNINNPFLSNDSKLLFFSAMGADNSKGYYVVYLDVPDCPAIMLGQGKAKGFLPVDLKTESKNKLNESEKEVELEKFTSEIELTINIDDKNRISVNTYGKEISIRKICKNITKKTGIKIYVDRNLKIKHAFKPEFMTLDELIEQIIYFNCIIAWKEGSVYFIRYSSDDHVDGGYVPLCLKFNHIEADLMEKIILNDMKKYSQIKPEIFIGRDYKSMTLYCYPRYFNEVRKIVKTYDTDGSCELLKFKNVDNDK